MKEKQLVKLGFEKVFVPRENSGDENNFYYYTYDIGNFCLITNDCNEGEKVKDWVVDIFDYDSFSIKDYKMCKQLIKILEDNYIKKKD